jgi:hypothetical protein
MIHSVAWGLGPSLSRGAPGKPKVSRSAAILEILMDLSIDRMGDGGIAID